MINYLRENGLLLLNGETLDELKKLPPHIFKTFEKDFFNGKIARAPWISGSETYSPEVALSESGRDAPSGSISAHIDDYLETHPVSKRQRMKDGSEAFNREEYWTWLVEPIVASLPLRDRRIDIVDPYIFDHMRTMDDKGKGAFDSANLGIVWFLQELQNTTIAGPSISVNIYTREDAPPDGMNLSKINELCQRHFAPIVNNKFQVNVNVIRFWRDRRNAKDLRKAYHGRRIYFNETRMIFLDQGMEDITMMDRGKGYLECVVNECTTYKKEAAAEFTNFSVGVIRDKYKTALWTDHPEYIIAV
jgi:hypothetical protein